HNGAMAMVGMTSQKQQGISSDKPLIFISTLGTTEKCVQEIRAYLEMQGKEVVVFHTVGSGGRAMEELMESESIEAVVDLSLHEMMDHRFGGDYDAGPDRGSVALKKGIPVVLVPGNIDFLVAGPLEQALKDFPGRPYHVHNSAITVVRSTREEMEIIAGQIADVCNAAPGRYTLVIPMKGFSAFDSKEGPLHDPEGPERFVKVLKARLSHRSRAHTLPYHINDSEFSEAVINRLQEFLS
ncbi:MAG: Tm-1-like ATP-binding domain-containing protein, partial [Deltaproteobacteria bacterium]|nr:Tm-1-like ATP-binding domain-containing protein [Deltaproteobacteria bacterium]